MVKNILKKFKENIKAELKEEILNEINESSKSNKKIKLKESLNGKSIHRKVIPAVYNLRNLLMKRWIS